MTEWLNDRMAEPQRQQPSINFAHYLIKCLPTCARSGSETTQCGSIRNFWNALPSLSCRMATLVTNFCIFTMHSVVVYHYSLKLFKNKWFKLHLKLNVHKNNACIFTVHSVVVHHYSLKLFCLNFYVPVQHTSKQCYASKEEAIWNHISTYNQCDMRYIALK